MSGENGQAGREVTVSDHRAGEAARADEDLIFAIVHEIGNHVGAIRLQAHLLDDDLDIRGLAEASVTIDDLAGRAAPLLALVRPLLGGGRASVASQSWAELFAGIRREFEDAGLRGVEFEITPPEDAALRPPSIDWLRSLLMMLVQTTLAVSPAPTRVAIGVHVREGGVGLWIEDDGGEEDLSADSAWRGRTLAVEIARRLLARDGGHAEVSRQDERTRIELVLAPTPPS